jgi:hypothetical protein
MGQKRVAGRGRAKKGEKREGRSGRQREEMAEILWAVCTVEAEDPAQHLGDSAVGEGGSGKLSEAGPWPCPILSPEVRRNGFLIFICLRLRKALRPGIMFWTEIG